MSTVFVNNYIRKSIAAISSLTYKVEEIEDVVKALVLVLKNAGRIYSCGNGGSACDAMHLVEELVARYLRERPGIPAQHLLDAATITCWANDYEFASIFERQVKTLVKPQDAIIFISTSGNSKNILLAASAAKEIGCTSIAFTGQEGGELAGLVNYCLKIDSNVTSHIQESHITLIHIICDLIEQELI